MTVPQQPHHSPTEVPLDVLIPTYRRPAALAVTLAGLCAQTLPSFRVVVSDQSGDGSGATAQEVQACARLLRARGRAVEIHQHLPRRGLAEHRQYLLDQAASPYALFLDDDVFCEPDVLARLLRVIIEQRCGFVGAPLVGLTHLDDVRPHQQHIERWDAPVQPEPFGPQDPRWQRHHLHSAANVWHVQQRLRATDEEPVIYKVAWVGGCVLYDVAKLRAVGGFEFWRQLPVDHCGEDVLVQARVRGRYGGCGVLPSGAYHQQLPTTVENRGVDAPYVLPCDVLPHDVVPHDVVPREPGQVGGVRREAESGTVGAMGRQGSGSRLLPARLREGARSP